jgi:hypothetical protein
VDRPAVTVEIAPPCLVFASGRLDLAHDPAKWKRFADKIMRHFKTLAREPRIKFTQSAQA